MDRREKDVKVTMIAGINDIKNPDLKDLREFTHCVEKFSEKVEDLGTKKTEY